MSVKVRVTAHRGHLIIDTEPPFEQTEEFVPNGDGKIGCVLVGTKELLGVSEEAIALLGKVSKVRDAIGDLMWWRTDDGKACFGWLGGVKAIKKASDAVGDRDYAVREGEYVSIPNEPDPEAAAIIDGWLDDDNDEGSDSEGTA